MNATFWRTFALTGLVCASIVGCKSSATVSFVDLNKVLDILVAVLNETSAGAKAPEGEEPAADDTAAPADTATATATTGDDTATAKVAVPKEDKEKEKEFLTKFAAKLNAANLTPSHIGVSVDDKGDITGFADANKNMTKEASEKRLFLIQIDEEGGRLIASDDQGHRRPHSYRGSGFLYGYMFRSMMGRNSNYYSGSRASARPNFRTSAMSPSNYHSTAVSKARASSSFKSSSSSSRSRSGSGGFSFGKN